MKTWSEKTTAEQLRAFACFLNPVLAELFIRAADELDELTKKVMEAGNA
jgi:hypothetical protein